MAFRIEWSIGDRKWEHAVEAFHRQPPSWGWEEGADAGLFHLSGPVQLRYEDEVLFPAERLQALWAEVHEKRVARTRPRNRSRLPPPPTATDAGHGFSVSLIDFASQIAGAAEMLPEAPDGTIAGFHNSAEGFSVGFVRTGADVVIRSALFKDIQLTVPMNVFSAGVEVFLADFAGAIRDRAPELFEWKSLSWLKAHLKS